MRSGDRHDTMLDARAWSELLEAVARFRKALRRGDRPAIEDYLPAVAAHRALFLLELIHEEMEFLIRGGHWPGLAGYLERRPDLALEREIVLLLAEAEAELRRRWDTDDGTLELPPAEAGAPRPAAVPVPSRIGRYELGEIIGRGAFGVVHRAYDTTLRRAVALKRPRPGAVEAPEAIERFLREARAVAGLRHPGIVAVHDAGEADGELYLVSELIEGRNLAEELAVRRPGYRASADWVASLAEALEHAHSLGLIHRDVKPSNVLIDAEGRVHLTDFGLAKSEGGEATLTVAGQVIGTPAYMAPEQAEGGEGPVDARTDVYSLGVILYELLTGSRPFAGAGAMLLARIREEEPRPPRRLDRAIPRDLETICLKCLQKDPRDRYPTAGALAEDLRRYLAGRPIAARPAPAWERALKWARRRPATAALAALCAASALGAIVAWLHGLDRQRRHDRSMLLAARAHAEEIGREARSTRRHLYAVEVDRAYDAHEAAHDELARQILDSQRPSPGEEDLRGFEWDYLWRLCDRDRVLRGHEARVDDLEFSPDGRALATAGANRMIRLWRTDDWAPLGILAGHENAVADLAFSPDGAALYSGRNDGTIRRWDWRSARPDGLLWRGPGAILCLAPSPDGRTLALYNTLGQGAEDNRLQFLDLATGAVEARVTSVRDATWSLDYSPDGGALAEARGRSRDVLLWDAAWRRVRARLPGRGAGVLGVRFSRDGRRLAACDMERTVQVWDVATGRLLGWQASATSPAVPAFSPDGRTVAFCGDGAIFLWDVDAARVSRIASTHLGSMRCLAFGPRGDVLASGGTDGTVRLWDVPAGRPLESPRPAGSTGPERLDLDEAAGYADGLAISPDGRWIAAGGFNGWIQVRDARTGEVRFRLPESPGPVRDLAFSLDARTLIAATNSASHRAVVRLFDMADGRLRLELVDMSGAPRPAWSVAMSPDARIVACGMGVLGEPGRIVVWDARSGAIRSVLGGHPDYVRGVAISPDGRILASGGGPDVRLWDPETGSPLAVLEGHRGPVLAVAFDPTGRWLASGAEDLTVRLWDVPSLREAGFLRGHTAPVQSVAFSPDGRLLASGAREGHIRLWDVATRRGLGWLTGHTLRINQVRFFPDGEAIASTSFDRTIRIWRGDPAGR